MQKYSAVLFMILDQAILVANGYFSDVLPTCQDVMILDQSVFFGVADVHDRHRDMRLDVDHMSYEVKHTKT